MVRLDEVSKSWHVYTCHDKALVNISALSFRAIMSVISSIDCSGSGQPGERVQLAKLTQTLSQKPLRMFQISNAESAVFPLKM